MFLVSTNLLQAGFDKDRVHSDRGDYMFVGQDGLQLRICGHNLSHNIVHSYYFGNLAFLHVVQDRLQAQSTPRTAFRQEGEDDEDMTSMDMDMGGEWHGSPTRPSRVFKSRRRPEVDSVRISKVEAQRNSSSSPSRSPGAARTKINAQAAYGVRFGCSLYGWKYNFKDLPMAPV